MPKLIRGDRLTVTQRRMVLNMFVYRWTIENSQRKVAWGTCPVCKTPGGLPGSTNIECRQYHPTIPLQSDQQWLSEHAFWFNANDTISRAHSYAEPAYLSDTTV
jgi:hypothetical protein